MAKSLNLLAKIWYGLTIHIRFFVSKFRSKIFQINILYFGKISSELCKFCTIHPKNSANHAKFAPFIYPLYTVFQMPDHWQRTL